MKELTIEQKAQRYDEAIKRAKGAHNSAKSDKENGVTDKITEYTIQLTEAIFPELKENGDERIRKHLIGVVELYYGKPDEQEKKDCLDWLEKQCRQKPADKEYTFKAIPRLLEMIQPTDRAKSYCQKLIDSLEQEGYSTDAKIVRGYLKRMNGEKIVMATMDEQKPAWSEEEKNILDDIIHDYEMANKSFCGYEARINWLKSLKDRVQPKQEWSEEDEMMLGKCLDAASGYYSPEDKQSMKDWLNSLKDRYTWKPSEIQLETLKELSHDVPTKKGIIEELLKQLKQL